MQPAHTFLWQHPFENSRFRILFVDDNLPALKSVRKILERAAYVVYTASTYQEALQILTETHVHLGIFDLNLAREDEAPEDTDPQNFEGLELAAHPNFPHLRMVYTGQKDYEIVVESMKHPRAVNYIVKGDDGEAQLLQKVEAALAEHLPLNQDLNLQWEQCSLQELVQHIYPDLSLAQQFEHIIELDDLFRMQFFGAGQDRYQQISIQTIATDKKGRVWLKVSAYSKRGRRFDNLVLCGERSLILQEAEQFDRLAPRSNKMRTAPVQTVHYGLHSFEIYDQHLHEIDTLSNLLKTGHHALIRDLIGKVHSARFQWFYRQEARYETGSLYQLALGQEKALVWDTTEQLFSIVNRISEAWQSMMPNSQLTVNQHEIIYSLARAEQQTYPNPIFHLEALGNYETTRAVGMVHGDLRLQSIFAQVSDAELYLLDYADVHEASLLRDYVTLERSIHTEVLSQLEISDYQMLARMLNETEAVDSSSLSASLQNAVAHIHQIRQLAMHEIECNLDDYLQDLYIDCLNYLLSYPQQAFVGYETIKRYAHCFLFAGQICADLQQISEVVFHEQDHYDGVWLDANENRLRVLGKSVALTDKQFTLLEYLYKNLNQHCTYAQIIENGLREKLMHGNIELEKPRIQTAISRLRPKLEPFGFEIEAWRDGYSLRRTDRD